MWRQAAFGRGPVEAVGHFYLIRARNRCAGYAFTAPRVGEFALH